MEMNFRNDFLGILVRNGRLLLRVSKETQRDR